MPLRRNFRPGTLEIGLDEAGRGCLAGPVYAAAVLLRPGKRSPRDLNDSKQIVPERREQLRDWIEEHALAWAVASCSPTEIDAENILQASMTAMHRALDVVHNQLITTVQLSLPAKPILHLVDGHYWRPYCEVPYSCQKGGDGRFQSIAAASILAKTYRDAHMCKLHEAFPGYAWNSNKGYATPPHQRALREHGPCEHHRKSFRLSY